MSKEERIKKGKTPEEFEKLLGPQGSLPKGWGSPPMGVKRIGEEEGEASKLINSVLVIIKDKERRISQKYNMMSTWEKNVFYRHFMLKYHYGEMHFRDQEKWMEFFEDNFLSFSSQDQNDLCRVLKRLFVLDKWDDLSEAQKKTLCERNIPLAKNVETMWVFLDNELKNIFLQRSDNLHYDFLAQVFCHGSIMKYKDLDYVTEYLGGVLSHPDSKVSKLIEDMNLEKLLKLSEYYINRQVEGKYE